jgi:uncharacterized membrane protein YtjA (UPF0391 family)
MKSRLWYLKFDWIGSGYILFVVGSLLYFIQACDPFFKTKVDDDDAKLNGYYSDGPLDDTGVSGTISLAASIIFVVEAVLYIISWYLCRNYGDMSIPISNWYLDWNHWGNILFLVGSVGYIYTADIFMSSRKKDHVIMSIVNVAMAVVFVFDSIFYFLALVFSDQCKTRFTYKQTRTFEYSIDLYLIATILFIVGSIIYLIEAVQAYNDDPFSELSSLLGSIVFMIDAPLYLLSIYQRRYDFDEVDLFNRKYFFVLEYSHPPEDYPDLMSRGVLLEVYKKELDNSEESHLSI